MKYDLVTLGETMLRLTPPGQQLIEQATELALYVGGSESNVAVGLARLGWRVAWLSRLTDNALGRRIATAIRAHGVDTTYVTWTDADRVGVYYVEEGPPPRGSSVIYDRAGSAMSRMQPTDLPIDLFTPDGARVLHLSGITLAIGEAAAQTAQAAAQRARSAGWLVSFDVNHRAMLWSAAAAAAGCDPLLALADVVFVAQRDAVTLYGAPDAPGDAIRHIQARCPGAVIVMTLGAEGALALTPDGAIWRQAAFSAQGSGRVGGGDAFAAGFLCGYLETQAVEQALTWGAAAAAYKYTLPGDMPLLDRARVRAIIDHGHNTGIQR
ncbi:MAG: sugar kinase [Phototrophicaceae bacterium]